jgi:hypothetical protein
MTMAKGILRTYRVQAAFHEAMKAAAQEAGVSATEYMLSAVAAKMGVPWPTPESAAVTSARRAVRAAREALKVAIANA